MKSNPNNLLEWATAVAETVESNQGVACSTTHVINLHMQENGKLRNAGANLEDANRQAMAMVEHILSNKGENDES